MIIIEIIAKFIIEVIFIEIIVGAISGINNGILKLRGIETRTVDEIKFDKLRNRYEHQSVMIKSDYREVRKKTKGIVLELIDRKKAIVEFENLEIREVEIKDLLIREIRCPSGVRPISPKNQQ